MRPIDADAIRYDENTECFGHGWFERVKSVTKERIDRMPTIEVPRWIPVAERLPEENAKYYLVYCDYGIQKRQYFGKGRWATIKRDGNVTHWMPLPTPPKDGDT